MSEILKAYLDSFPAHHESIERWPIQGKLRVRLSLASTLPPADVSSSILAIVLNSDRQVLFLHPSTPSGSIAHVLIGGRPENGETPPQTATREVGEETGWRIEPIRMIGFRHFFHLEPWVEKSDRPYPDFVQPIFAARAVTYDASLALLNDHIPSKFIAFDAAEQAIDPTQRPLLRAALGALG
jgi:8-oxo-dGTP pyrophosphatase MutT (NUDIX family)